MRRSERKHGRPPLWTRNGPRVNWNWQPESTRHPPESKLSSLNGLPLGSFDQLPLFRIGLLRAEIPDRVDAEQFHPAARFQWRAIVASEQVVLTGLP